LNPVNQYLGPFLEDIRSGIGVMHNALLFDRTERSVIYGPFRVWPKPAWFVTNCSADRILPRLVRFEADPGVRNLARVVWTAVAG
jgi:hypothetical protein